jgi:inosine-uridine nucleoside N-ribohydrolase
MLLLDTDNALGSSSGDVDDGFAVAALLASGLPIAGLLSVAGNTSEAEAAANNGTLGALAGYRGRYLRGVRGVAAAAEEGERIDRAFDLWSGPGEPLRWIALGPLTNLAAVLAAADRQDLPHRNGEVVLVGGTRTSLGRWPPFWPMEFNLTQDPAATAAVFASSLPLTVVPLDQGRRLRAGPRRLAELSGPLGGHLRRGSRRWLLRNLRVKGRASLALFDLLAAAYVIAPEFVHLEETATRLAARTRVEFGKGGRPVRSVRGFDGEAIWQSCRTLINGEA